MKCSVCSGEISTIYLSGHGPIPVFDDTESYVHTAIGAVAGAVTPRHPAAALAILALFSAYQLSQMSPRLEGESKETTIGDFVEFAAGAVPGYALAKIKQHRTTVPAS